MINDTIGVEPEGRALFLAVVVGDIGACLSDPRPSSARVPFDLKLPEPPGDGFCILFYLFFFFRVVLV